MGMHRDGTNAEFDPIERNTRRQVWWSIYTFEKILCSILGRPTVIDDSEMAMKTPDAPMLEQRSMSAEFMSFAFDLIQMSYRLRQKAYFNTETAEERSPTLAVAYSLLQECDAFYETIPRHLSVDFAPGPADQRARILLLYIYYYYTRCIVTRDFLIQKVERNIAYLENQTPPYSENWDSTLALGEDCVESAHQSLHCIMAGSHFGMMSYSWLDLFFVFHAVFIVCADFLARPRGQLDSPKDVERKDMVRVMLGQVRGMKKLAPTYKILSRIAMQFAGMTGVYDESSMSDPTTQGHEQSLESSGEGDDASSGHVEISDVQEDWFASATSSLGLDFFDLGQAATPASVPVVNPTFNPYYNAKTSELDDWTAKHFEACTQCNITHGAPS